MRLLLSTWEGRLVLGAALWASALAGVAAVVINANDDGPADPWRMVLLAFLATPFALAVFAEAAARARPARRAMVLGSMVVPAAGVTLLSYLLALPALVMLIGATVLAIREAASAYPTLAGGAALLAAVAMAGLWVAGFASLFRVDDERCVTLSNGYACTSDVVTSAEALTGLGALAVSAVLGAAVLRLGRARNQSPAI